MKRVSKFERLSTVEERREAVSNAIANADKFRNCGYRNYYGREGMQFVEFLSDFAPMVEADAIEASTLYSMAREAYPNFYTMLNGNEEPRKCARRNG